MKFVKQPKHLGKAFLITIVLAIYGGLLSIEGMSEWYPSLIKPIDIPIWLFGIVQPAYYLICVTILYRLYTRVEKSRVRRRTSMSLFVFMMFFAESWNFFFLGLKSVSLGFWLLLIFCLVVISVFLNLRRVDKNSSLILLPYLIWLVADIMWIFEIWQAN